MLYIPPETSPFYRILSIDPGTDTLGIAILDVDVLNLSVYLTYATTLHGAKGARNYPHISDTFGNRQAKFHSHKLQIARILRESRPNCVISEAPFMGRFPQAFEALVECLYMLREVVAEYNPSLCLESIDPPTVKKAVGVTGKGGGKDPVKKCVLALDKLINTSGIDLTTLDEHAIDAIAVGCYKLKCISNDII